MIADASCLAFVRRGSLIALAAVMGLSQLALAEFGTPLVDVSFHSQVRPILQSHCQGCHQNAKAGGDYVMTSFDRLLAGGESETEAIVPGSPEDSYLLELITPSDAAAEMPKGKEPLSDAEVALIRAWIEQGAKDDSPASSRPQYSAENPPLYFAPPVITSLDYSPDGQLLAVAGFHEVLLHKADGSGLVGRLVGMSQRIESVRFSPDGTRLAVAGGQPASLGEVQVWDVAERSLITSLPITYDTVYGANWSPDGKLVSFGCADNTVRVIEAETGNQVLFQGSHNDWVFDSVFSVDGSHVITVGRDRTAKLTELATQRFVDNVTSITPGGTPGGISSIDRHPTADAIVVGGADRVPKIFRIHRESKRVIGDDGNLIKKFPALIGHVYGVVFTPDGKRVVAVSSANGRGELAVYAVEFEVKLPDELKKIVEKVINTRSSDELKKLETSRTAGVALVARTEIVEGGLYAVAPSPDGKTIATAGADGRVRLFNADSATLIKEFLPVEIATEDQIAKSAPQVTVDAIGETTKPPPTTDQQETLPEGAQVVGITVEPKAITLDKRFDTVQLVATAELASGDTFDATRLATRDLSADVVEVSPGGLVRPVLNGQARLTLTIGEFSALVPIDVSEIRSDAPVSFQRDVAPVISRLGCNAGTCHGSKDGQNGFKLSLRGYDSLLDIQALTDDLASRRIAVASPEDSLALLKATSQVPHVGGQVTRPGQPYYEILRRWISDGAKLDANAAEITGIDVFPRNPIVQKIGDRQQVRVVATYADGSRRDVTAETFIESGDTDVVKVDETGLVSTLRRGESAILARYEGAYAATTITVMGDRGGFVWQQPAANNYIDELVAAKWQRMKIEPSALCSDADFVRRVYLDVTGLPPTADAVRSFVADARDTKTKRAELIDQLVGGDEYVEHWANKWADLLQVNRKFLGAEGAKAFRQWIREQIAENRPYDEFARSVLTASGSNREHPAASYYKILRTPDAMMENTTHLFLAVRFNCNKCHDHPFERWTQDQYYQTAAFFAQVGLEKDPESKNKTIGGTAVEGATPLYEMVVDKAEGDVTHERTGAVTPPKFPFLASHTAPEDASRRERLAQWITSSDNEYFARSYVNRVWGYLMGVGLMEPLDDIRAGNPPTNPELLERLTAQFVESGFDVQDLIRTICKSRTYQLSIETNHWNEDDNVNFSHARARRLPAEVLFDSIHRVAGSQTKIPGVPPGIRAAALPDVGVKVPGGFLQSMGRPARESACECERTSGMELGPVMTLVSGPTLNDAIRDPENDLAKLAASEMDDSQLVNELFMRILNRPATDAEKAAGVDTLRSIPSQHETLLAEVDDYREQLKPILVEREKERLERIDQSKHELAEYEKELAPRLAELEKQRQEKTKQLEEALAAYDAKLPEYLARWEKEKAPSRSVWIPLAAHQLSSTFGAKLEQQEDRSILVTESNGAGSYQLAAKTDLIGITAVRIEALTDNRLPNKKGPGRASSGNFVLTEFNVGAASLSDPATVAPVNLQNAKADFSQGNYDVKTAIDGKLDKANNGWAIAPQSGVDHSATFELSEPVGDRGGTLLTFELTQLYQDNQHTLGKFRISVTTSPQPVQLDGIPRNVADVLAIAVDRRNAKQTAGVLEYFRSVDEERLKQLAAIAESKKPLPIDPRLKQLQEQVARVSEPLPKDRTLARLERAVNLSTQHVENARLIATQDIAWALINSPAFLFNR